MNERIKELEKQAYDFANSIVLPDSYNDTACSWHRRVAFNEKFAELIVRECVWIGYNHCATHKSQDEYKFTDSLDRIKEHFGVEE